MKQARNVFIPCLKFYKRIFQCYVESFIASSCSKCNLNHIQSQLVRYRDSSSLPPEVVFHTLRPKSLPLEGSWQLSKQQRKSFIISQRNEHYINLSVTSPPDQYASACLCTLHARSQHSTDLTLSICLY